MQHSSLAELRRRALSGGGPIREASQHRNGKRTARERIAALLDPNSFEETDQLVRPFITGEIRSIQNTTPRVDVDENEFLTDGVVTGFGTIGGRSVALYAQDFTQQGGSVGRHHAEKICRLYDRAGSLGIPLIALIDSGGARISEGVHALAGYGELFSRIVRYSGVIPQLSAILGPCAGGAVYAPALTDLVCAVEKISSLFITGPQVVARVCGGAPVDKERLGGGFMHSARSGVVHLLHESEEACFHALRSALSYLPDNYRSTPPTHAAVEPSHTLPTLPASPDMPYDMHTIIESVVDDGSFFEIQRLYAPQMVVGFARINGRSVGIVANNPAFLAGAIDCDAAVKGARFITLCESFSIPLVTLVDTPGFLPGVEQEESGIIRHGAKLIAAYSDATIPFITVIVRKAYGGAYIVMGSSHLGADAVYAWPSGEIAVLGAAAAIEILHGKEFAALPTSEAEQARAIRENNYRSAYLNPDTAAAYGYITGIIDPTETRSVLIRALTRSVSKVRHRIQKNLRNTPL